MPGGQSTQWVATARMLRRAGFGVTGLEVGAAVGRDWSGYVDAMLAANPDADPGAIATPMPSLEPPRAPGKGTTPVARKQYNKQLSEQLDVLSDWWLRRMVADGRTESETAHTLVGRFPHPGLRDADRRRDVALAGRADQHRQGPQRKPRPRI